MIDLQLREYFDSQVELVLRSVPDVVRKLLDETPLIVEDHPSPETLRRLGIKNPRNLCGLYSGIPITQRSVEISGVPSDVVYLYREGILALATDQRGHINEAKLLQQIRITILHELGHLHGLDEDELTALGYG